ncbi:MAG: nuclear transport factor 2 family protein [Chloroflexota bacterium]
MSDPMTEEQRVAALEDEWLAAEVAHDEAFLRRVIDDRYTMNLRTGTTLGKEEYINGILEGVMLSVWASERTVLVDGDTAVTFATVNVIDPGKSLDDPPRSSRYTLVYVKRHGEWRALAFHIGQRSDD